MCRIQLVMLIVSMAATATAIAAADAPTNVIPVNGRASHTAPPDVANLTLLLSARGNDANAAHTALHGILGRVTAAIAESRLPPESMVVGRVGTVRSQGKKDSEEAMTASREVLVTVGNILAFDALDAALIAIPGATITAQRFDLRDRDAIVRKLLVAAAEDARAQATAIAGGAAPSTVALHQASPSFGIGDGVDAQRTIALPRDKTSGFSIASSISSGSYGSGVENLTVPPLFITLWVAVDATYVVGGKTGP